MTRTLAHLSDLHIGRSAATDRRAAALCETLVASRVDHVVATGDLTHRGRVRELARFREIFAPLFERGRITIVPGNHDCLTEDVSGTIMNGGRVEVTNKPGLHLVRFNSTGPHNRSWINGHGAMSEEDVRLIVAALDEAPTGTLSALLLHHHVLPLPGDLMFERLTTFFGWPWCAELALGHELLMAIRGRCDLVLHGHRHSPGTLTVFPEDRRPISVYNAGSSTELGHVRVFSHAAGRLAGPPAWLAAASLAPAMASFREYIGFHRPPAGGGLAEPRLA